MLLRRSTIAAVAALLAVVGVSAAMADPRVEDGTGRDTANQPPPRHFDHLRLRVDLDIPDMAVPKLAGTVTALLTPVGTARDRVVLRAGEATLTVSSASFAVVPGVSPRGSDLSAPEPSAPAMPEGIALAPAAFTHEGDRLVVTLPSPVRPGQMVLVRVAYSGEFPAANGTGLTWTPGDPEAEGATAQSPQLHSQGQPEFNHTWFPCHDFPNDRLATEMVVTVEDGLSVVSNGRLLSTRLGTPSPSGKTRTTWHWVQDQPHPAYLVSLVIGKFAVVGLPTGEGGPVLGAGGAAIPITLYTPLGTQERAAEVYADTPRMLRFYAEYFDEPYPWDKYAQVLVRRFFAGGMENTSASTMREESARSTRRRETDVIAHEIAHQWTGNLITCRSWEHAWLNEGWASFAEALWAEHAAEEGRSTRAYQAKIARFLAAQRGLNRTYAPQFPGLASPYYNAALDVFMKPNDIYAKGAVVLHMLRMQLGDEVFQRATRVYVDRFKFRQVETDDFRRVLEEVSGRSMERFFAQWVRRPGLPRLAAELTWTDAPTPGPNEGGGTLEVRVTQTQRIDADNPAYAFDLPIELKLPGGRTRMLSIPLSEREHAASFVLDVKPVDVVFDPLMTAAAPTTIRKPLAMWLEQAEHGSALAAAQALEHLAGVPDERARAAVARLAESLTPDQFPAELAGAGR